MAWNWKFWQKKRQQNTRSFVMPELGDDVPAAVKQFLADNDTFLRETIWKPATGKTRMSRNSSMLSRSTRNPAISTKMSEMLCSLLLSLRFNIWKHSMENEEHESKVAGALYADHGLRRRWGAAGLQRPALLCCCASAAGGGVGKFSDKLGRLETELGQKGALVEDLKAQAESQKSLLGSQQKTIQDLNQKLADLQLKVEGLDKALESAYTDSRRSSQAQEATIESLLRRQQTSEDEMKKLLIASALATSLAAPAYAGGPVVIPGDLSRHEVIAQAAATSTSDMRRASAASAKRSRSSVDAGFDKPIAMAV